MKGGWFVSLDTGLVSFFGGNPDRIVGFAYTGLAVNGYEDDPIGLHPLVGYWSIADDTPDDDDHEPQYLIIHPNYVPNTQLELKYDAGLVRVDIPSDGADDHGAAIVYVQDTMVSGEQYRIYGFDSLYDDGFVWISYPDEELFDEAVLPSIAVHGDGDSAAVTYFARDGSGDWEVFATHWDFVDNQVAAPTDVDLGAEGTWNLIEMLQYDWGTGSSLVSVGGYMYWAAWSDEFASGSQPERIFGSMGIAND